MSESNESMNRHHASEAAVDTVTAWIEAVNAQDLPALLAVSDAAIEIVGPKGSAHGHEVLSVWLERAGLRLKPLGWFSSGSQFLLRCEGEWLDSGTNQSLGRKELMMSFEVTGDKVTRCQRFDKLDQALSV